MQNETVKNEEKTTGRANTQLIDFLAQVESYGNCTGCVKLRMEEEEGAIYFQNGHVVHASVNGLTGEAAFFLLLLQPKMTIYWDAKDGLSPRTLHRSLDELMVDLCRLEDSQTTSYEAILQMYPSDREHFQPRRDYTGCQVVLDAITPELDGLHFEIAYGDHSIGKSSDCCLRVPHATVSSHHANLHFDASAITIQDNGSTNGLCVNGKIVTEAVLVSGDLLALGYVTFRVTVKIKRKVGEHPLWEDKTKKIERRSRFKRLTMALSGRTE
jgi:hypothetical protein